MESCVVTIEKISRELAGGEAISGEALASKFNVTRAAIWKAVHALRAMGMDISAVRGQGYLVRRPFEMLDGDQIFHYLRTESNSPAASVSVHFQIESTNSELLSRMRAGTCRPGSIVLAESQSGGKGRRGRKWISPLGGNIYASVGWTYDGSLRMLTGLPLAVAANTIAQLEDFGIEGLTIKWPNDILFQGAKLGGILLEVIGEADGRCHVVCGIGLNVLIGSASGRAIDQRWTDLQTISNVKTDRNRFAARICGAVLNTMAEFPDRGFKGYLNAWSAYDALRNRRIVVHTGSSNFRGVAKGVDEEGALIVEMDNMQRRFYGGEVTVRQEYRD